jgi:hypothetical protein
MDHAAQRIELIGQINAGAKVQMMGPMAPSDRFFIGASRVVEKAASTIVVSGVTSKAPSTTGNERTALFETAQKNQMVFIERDVDGKFSARDADICNIFPEPELSTLAYRLTGAMTTQESKDPAVLADLEQFNRAKVAAASYLDTLIDQRTAGHDLGALNTTIDQVLVLFARIDHLAKADQVSPELARRSAHQEKLAMLDSIGSANAVLCMAGAGGAKRMADQSNRLVHMHLAKVSRQNPATELSEMQKIAPNNALLFGHLADQCRTLNARFAAAAVNHGEGAINPGILLKTMQAAVKLSLSLTHEVQAEKNTALARIMKESHAQRQALGASLPQWNDATVERSSQDSAKAIQSALTQGSSTKTEQNNPFKAAKKTKGDLDGKPVKDSTRDGDPEPEM